MRSGIRFWALVAAVAAALSCGAPAEAACTISATGVAFGTYDMFNPSATTSEGSVTYDCTVLLSVGITVTLSTGSSGSYALRAMQGPSMPLGYNLFRDASRTQVWGDGTGGTHTYFRLLGIGHFQETLTVYGEVPALQSVWAGSYLDTVRATIQF